MLREDCPLAPLEQLFSAAFLGTTRGRFALTAAVPHCVPYMPQGGFTETFRKLLDEPLRQYMKVCGVVPPSMCSWTVCVFSWLNLGYVATLCFAILLAYFTYHSYAIKTMK